MNLETSNGLKKEKISSWYFILYICLKHSTIDNILHYSEKKLPQNQNRTGPICIYHSVHLLQTHPRYLQIVLYLFKPRLIDKLELAFELKPETRSYMTKQRPIELEEKIQAQITTILRDEELWIQYKYI